MTAPAAAHATTAAIFSSLVAGVSDWDASTPVKEWTVRDVVGHLTSWLPGLLGASGVTWSEGPSASYDPVGAWEHQRAAVQAVLEDPDRAALPVAWPGGEKAVADVIAEFYEPDVFMHAWDLARGSGQDFHLDTERCAATVAGFAEIEPMLRASGQFGEQMPVRDGATPEEQLIAFIGRDPYWQPTG